MKCEQQRRGFPNFQQTPQTLHTRTQAACRSRPVAGDMLSSPRGAASARQSRNPATKTINVAETPVAALRILPSLGLQLHLDTGCEESLKASGEEEMAVFRVLSTSPRLCIPG